MKFLIFGGNGFLGNYLFQNLKNSFESHRISRIKNNGIYLKRFNEKNIIKVLLKIEPDIIINTIAMTDVDACEKKIVSARNSNIKTIKTITNSILKISTKNYSPFLIHISTDQVYSGKGPHKESNIKPINNYAKTKLIGEKVASKVKSCIIRTNFLGYSQKNKNFNSWIINNVFQNKKIFGYKNIFFSPVSVNTLLKIIIKISKKKIEGIFNIGSIGSISKGEYIYKLIKNLFPNYKNFYNSNYIPIKSKKRAIRPLDMTMNCDKIIKKHKIKLPITKNEINKIINNLRNEI